MPIYQYHCTDESCTGEAEAFVPKEPVPEHCPVCGKDMKKVLSTGTSFALKGGGWYKDGYSKGAK